MPHATDTADVGVPISPMEIGITYGIFRTKQTGVSTTTAVSLGENLKYRRNISKKAAPITIVHSRLNAYRCSNINSAAMITIKFVGIKEHIRATIKTIGSLFTAAIYPRRELISRRAVNASRNFKKGVI